MKPIYPVDVNGFQLEDMPMHIIDSHLHLDILLDQIDDTVDWFQRGNIFPISWSYAYAGVQTVEDLHTYFAGQHACFSALQERLPCAYLVGIHPRNLPATLRPEQVGELLEPWITQPGCIGLGEIGIDTDDPREAEIFEAQVIWSAQLPEQHVVGVHTPRANKTGVTERILAILDRCAARPDRVVVDHCSAETLAKVLQRPYWAGVSLSPNKSSVDEAVAMLLAHADQLDRVMCNTDSAIACYDHLTQLVRDTRLTQDQREQVLKRSAARCMQP
ncbi:MAG: putative metal-dependent TIM-barrel fold hydrolase [Verrucomicrobiales bacterium]|jgi:predicted metal-dependent TIM-barrel fold hydrolase